MAMTTKNPSTSQLMCLDTWSDEEEATSMHVCKRHDNHSGACFCMCTAVRVIDDEVPTYFFGEAFPPPSEHERQPD
jgi:hypothetical protein